MALHHRPYGRRLRRRSCRTTAPSATSRTRWPARTSSATPSCSAAWAPGAPPVQIDIARRVYPPRTRCAPAGSSRPWGRHRRPHDRREDGGRRLGQAVPGHGRAGRGAGRQGPRAGQGLRRGRPARRRRPGLERWATPAPTRPDPPRSVLYMPGANERALEKAAGLLADALILDLEDAVAPDAKAEARDRARGCRLGPPRPPGGGHPGQRARHPLARRRHPGRGGGRAGGRGRPQGGLGRRRARHREGAGGRGAPPTRPSGPWWRRRSPCSTPRRWPGPPSASPCWSWAPTTWPRSCRPSTRSRRRCSAGRPWRLLAARATGKVILDGVYNDIRDPEGFEAECVQGRQMGFDGKTLIHPGQLEPCNRVFAPPRPRWSGPAASSPPSRRPGPSGGVVTVDGRMVENLHVDQARHAGARRRDAWSPRVVSA